MKRFLETCSLFFAIGVLILLVVLFFIRGKNDVVNENQSLAHLEQQIVRGETDKTTDIQENEEKPVFVDSIEIDSETAEEDASELEEKYPVIELGRVEKYYNKPLEYGFLMPYGNYYSGFGSQDGASHSVGISTEGVPEGFSDSQVQVLYFGSVKSDLPEGEKIWDENNTIAYKVGDVIYVRVLDEYDIQIRGEILSDTAQAIVQTIYVGVNSDDITE